MACLSLRPRPGKPCFSAAGIGEMVRASELSLRGYTHTHFVFFYAAKRAKYLTVCARKTHPVGVVKLIPSIVYGPANGSLHSQGQQTEGPVV